MKTFIRQCLAALALGLVIPSGALAQERPNTILVLDASGSMWGQIEGVNKIAIARDVVADILSDFPEDQNLGFVTYGHRERGSCTDIQTVIAPAPGTAPEIVKIVNELNPRGMTPMTDAVITAAQALRHTEQAATVILVSDGIETCNPDPCAAARALEEAGVDFTAHVIGFDVKGEAEALSQMQCLAEETGGRFLTADNAEELGAALAEVVAPMSGPFTFTANLATTDIGPEPVWDWTMTPPDAPLVPGTVRWDIDDAKGDRFASGETNPFTVELPFGDYTVTVYSEAHDIFSQESAVYAPDSIHMIHVMFPPAEPPLAELTLRAAMDSETGPLVETPVIWSIGQGGDAFEIEGSPVTEQLRPGAWQITGYHVVLEQEQVLDLVLEPGEARTATLVFETPLPEVTLIAPETAPAASTLGVKWQNGNLHPHETIALLDLETGRSFSSGYTDGKDEVRLLLPPRPGTYELRYISNHEIVGRKPLEVTPVEIALIAPETVPAASSVEVSWTGLPAARYDLITLGPLEGGANFSEARSKNGTSVTLRAPSTPGRYLLAYEQRLGEPVVTKEIEVTPVDIRLIAPQTVAAGSEIEVTWTGLPTADYDLVRMHGTDGSKGRAEKYTRNAERVTLKVPETPGSYEIIYLQGNLTNIVARLPVTVTPAE